MPTYDYKCKECKHEFEAFQSMMEAPIKICPECGGPVKRLIGSGGGLIFKGSGFYATDYKKKDAFSGGKKPPKKEEKKDKAAAGEGSDKKQSDQARPAGTSPEKTSPDNTSSDKTHRGKAGPDPASPANKNE
jgi:putative FmdB family regulatory protein